MRCTISARIKRVLCRRCSALFWIDYVLLLVSVVLRTAFVTVARLTQVEIARLTVTILQVP
jgi:RNase P subunit RPR2